MNIRSVLKKILSLWTALATLGFVMLVGGCTQTLRFLHNVPLYKELTARQLVRELIIPHMIMLCGMGVLVATVIFMVRGIIIHTRMQHDAV
ncbi:MAG: hypothetical protein HN341_14090 [Verrucomicrobia bacterium]|jgi:hypothetical protein|nr:hypothetical protein [Verrucomicrobiota bacterium]